MLNFLRLVFGSPKAIEKIADSASRGLDKLVYTEEERETDAANERREARGMIVDWIGKSQGQNIARRFLAFVIVGTWLAQYWFIMFGSVGKVWVENEKTAEKVQASVDIITNAADGMTGAVMLIIGFYFAAPHLANIVGPAMNRFGGKSGS